MNRIEYNRYGGPEHMHLAPFAPPALGPNDVLVQVKAASANPVDWGIRHGKMRMLSGRSFPRGMGKDLAGTVVQVGARVTDWTVGDAVLGCTTVSRAGAFAPLAVVRAADIVAKPETLSFEDAAALPTIGLTAWHGLIAQAKLKSGQTLLVNGAAGGVGTMAVQIAQSMGVTVTARVGARSVDRMRSMGVADTLDYRDPLPAALNGRFDVIFDCNGSLTARDIDRLLTRGGVAVDITFKTPKLLRAALLRRQKLASGLVDRETLQAVADFAAAHGMPAEIGVSVPLEEAIPLLTRLEEGQRLDGKAVITFE